MIFFSSFLPSLITDSILQPREALLKFATGEPNEFTSVWDKNQPKPVFDLRPDEAEEDIAREVNRKAKAAREARMRENNGY